MRNQLAGRGRRFQAAAWGVTLCLAAAPAAAFTLGRVSGTPLIGRTLQVAVPLATDGASGAPCLHGELLQGEFTSPVDIRLARVGDGTYRVHVTSTVPVQEPVITVNLTVGCSQPLTRGYVLLAEPPRDERQAMAPPANLSTVERPLSLAMTASLMTAQDPPEPVTRRREGERAAVRRAAPAEPAEPPPTRSMPRLRLESPDFAIDQAPALRISMELGKPGSGGGALKREEAAAVWQALNSTPQQRIITSQLTQAQQVELGLLRDLVQKQGAQLTLLTERLDRTQGERNLLANLLGAVAATLALGFGFLLWRRARDNAGGRWWEGAAAAPPAPAAAVPAASSAPAAAAVADEVDSDLDSNWTASAPPSLAEEAEAAARAPASPRQRPAPLSNFADSQVGRSRLPKAEELLDVQEKVDFFLAVNQPDKAIAVMEALLQEHLGESPFLWLDLLDLCRRLSRQADYERVRVLFQKNFAARLPPYAEAKPNSRGLEGYPRAMSRVQVLWGSPRVLTAIEESLFEEPGPGSITFDLDASRDLLLLYAIASDVLGEQEEMADEEDSRFDRTAVQQLSGLRPQATAPVPLAALDAVLDDEPPEIAPDIDFTQWERDSQSFGVHLALLNEAGRPLPSIEAANAPEGPPDSQEADLDPWHVAEPKGGKR